MPPARWIQLLGVLLLLGGLITEAVAMLGVAFYPIRRALPIKTPLTLQSTGCICFAAGAILMSIGRAML